MRTLRWMCLALTGVAAGSVETGVWSQGVAADYEKGALQGVSLRSDGLITLAPSRKEVLDAATAVLWAVVRDSQGAVYAAGGGSGSTVKIYKLDRAGKNSIAAEVEGLEIHALAVDAKDQLYAATSPDGKVWRIGADGKPTVFYDPRAKYIWSMCFDSRGDLIVGTGDKGEIHRVSPAGRGTVWGSLDDAHARALAADSSGSVFAGSEPSGLIVKLSPGKQPPGPDGAAAEVFVLHQSTKREITALAARADGTLFAAAAGNKQPAAFVPPLAPPAPSSPAPPNSTAAARPTLPAPPAPLSLPGVAAAGGSELIEIGPDGAPSVIWTHGQEVAYAVAVDPSGRPWVGTGNKGVIYRIDNPVLSTNVRSVSPSQVTGLLFSGSKLYAATANAGKLYELGPDREAAGSVESDIFDAGRFSLWGRLDSGSQAGGGRIAFETRSGNLDRAQSSWSAWTPLNGGRVASPPARFLQWRARLGAPPVQSAAGPQLSGVDIAWLPKNVAPRVELIEATPLNYRFPAPSSLIAAAPATLTLPPLGRRSVGSGIALDTSASSSVTLSYAKGSAGLRWLAADGNGDELVYSVEIRGAAESSWKVLREKVRERFVSFDSTAYPDGEYVARVTASDAPGNPPQQSLTASLESEPFLIDNTAPLIESLSGQPAGGRIQLRFQAKDELSWIAKAEYSLNGVEWLIVEPVNRLSDSRELNYDLLLDRPAPGEVTVAVRVTDSEGNQRLGKVVVR